MTYVWERQSARVNREGGVSPIITMADAKLGRPVVFHTRANGHSEGDLPLLKKRSLSFTLFRELDENRFLRAAKIIAGCSENRPPVADKILGHVFRFANAAAYCRPTGCITGPKRAARSAAVEVHVHARVRRLGLPKTHNPLALETQRCTASAVSSGFVLKQILA
jgi:hypothetical protein